jgi:hypothetical protein
VTLRNEVVTAELAAAETAKKENLYEIGLLLLLLLYSSSAPSLPAVRAAAAKKRRLKNK